MMTKNIQKMPLFYFLWFEIQTLKISGLKFLGFRDPELRYCPVFSVFQNVNPHPSLNAWHESKSWWNFTTWCCWPPTCRPTRSQSSLPWDSCFLLRMKAKKYPQCTPVIATDFRFLLTYYDQYVFLHFLCIICIICNPEYVGKFR